MKHGENGTCLSCLGAVRGAYPWSSAFTNFVTVNDCANILLAAGGSPPWPDIREVEEAVAESSPGPEPGAIGGWRPCSLAGKRAQPAGHPGGTGPGGGGVTSLRREACRRLLAEAALHRDPGQCLRIRAPTLGAEGGSGVDVSARRRSPERRISPRAWAMPPSGGVYGAVTALGPGGHPVRRNTDRSDPGRRAHHEPGEGRVYAHRPAGAFCGGQPGKRPLAAGWAAAVAAMDLAGERAEARRLKTAPETPPSAPI